MVGMATLSGDADQGFAIGPFSGGLNKLENPRVIGDDQLAICQNMDIGRSGELSIRPGLRLIRSNISANPITAVGSALLANNTSRMYVRDAVTNTLYSADGSAISDGVSAYTALTVNAGNSEKVVQYANSAWIIPKGTSAVGVQQNLLTNTSTTVPSMPRGTSALVFKDRLFIFGPVDLTNTATQRIYYSAATDFTNFPASNFFDINPGDGEGTTAAIASNDTLVFFKRHSTWALFYDSDPGLGTLRKINAEIGATGPRSVTAFENVLYLIDERTVYRIQNLLFTDIGKNISLRTERNALTFGINTTDHAVNFGPKIMFVIYTGTSGMPYEYYVYNTEVDAWTQYVFNQNPSIFIPVVAVTGFRDYIATAVGSSNLLIISPFRNDNASFGDYPGAVTAVMVQTKRYSAGTTSRYKRLFWWGMEVSSNGSLSMTAISTNILNSVTAVRVGSGDYQFFKAFTPSRFRYIEFLMTSLSPSHRLTILPGQAYVSSNKNEVNDAVNT
jgi:hypothetical protein